MDEKKPRGPISAFESPTFGQDGSCRLDKPVGAASISPCGRDIVLASRQGLHVIDLDTPYSPPRHLSHHTPWEVADVQWSPFAARDYWIVSTSNQKALVWNLGMASSRSSVEHVLHAHTRAITDINFSAHHPDMLATCAVDSFVHCWDLRYPARPAMTFCDWFAGATQVKWNRQNSHILASSHDRFLRIWDDRKGAHPLRSIEAHDTKIYGVDWNRTETTKLMTCSLDRTVKLWDYEEKKADESPHEPEQILCTPFPVWRARYTPFGFGLLAMPQRGDYDLHLYDRRCLEPEDNLPVTPAVYQFGGHENQVKEFLWRSRGNVTDNIDDREFQLVSWGTDRILRLHQVDEDVLGRVGFEKGVNRNFNVTRRNAVYKTFRDEPSSKIVQAALEDPPPVYGLRSALTAGMSKAPTPLVGGYGNGGFMSPAAGRKTQSPKDMDPISWMRGVKIGKREPSPSAMQQSISSIISPSLKTDPSWDVFEHLGEEITHVGDKFRKVKFDEIDVQRRKIIVSLSGPWGSDRSPTYVKAHIEFPSLYPDAAPPSVFIENTAAMDEDVELRIFSDVARITASFVSRQRSSLEPVLRYLLGEQSVEESLLWLRKRHESVDLDSTQDLDLSSSDEDEDALGRYPDPQASILEVSDPLVAVSNAQYNVPLPKACGALWADNGCLVCFFPPKPEKEPSLLDLNLKSADRSSKYRNPIFEGFGRLQSSSSRQKRAASTLETIESGDSDFEDSSSSSSSSSFSSDGTGLARHHFMPSMAWHGESSELPAGATVDESQKSSGDSGLGKSTVWKGTNFVSIHELSDLLPAKLRLAQKYAIGYRSTDLARNAQIAREEGDLDLADVWSFIKLLLEHKIPLELMKYPRSNQSVMIIARRAVSALKAKDSAIDLSFDAEEDRKMPTAQASIKWGSHPFGRQRFVDCLFSHYEQLADVQMLAMLSCVFSETRNSPKPSSTMQGRSSPPSSFDPKDSPDPLPSNANDYYASQEIAVAQLTRAYSDTSVQVDYQHMHSGPHSATSSTGPPLSDLSTSGTPPSNYRPLRASFERRESQGTSLSTSPEQLRHNHRSSSNLSALAASFTRSLPFSVSAASSPPKMYPKKRLSPAASYLGTSASSMPWSSSDFFSKSSTITEDPRSTFSLSISDTEEDIAPPPKKPVFGVKLKNQNQFHNEGYANVSLMDPSQEWRFRAYREAYAHLLSIWNLPVARSKVLKYNTSLTASTPTQKPISLLSIGKADLANTTSDTADLTVGFRSHCRSCSSVLPTKLAGRRRCSNCNVTQRSSICLLCNNYIRGLSSPCLSCGHLLHTSCRKMLILQSPDFTAMECPSGCGCICADHTTFQIDTPEPPVSKQHYELSPAITVIGDAGMNEQEQLGWRDTGIETEDWEDVNVAAYESLTRNLQLRPRRQSSGGVARRSGSQIWRARKGSR